MSDKEKKELGASLNNLLVKVLGTLPLKGFPCVADPLGALKRQNIPVIIDQSSGERPAMMSEEIFLKGFDKMSASEH
ncbi:hypothetical protein CROQUDRAFT_662282 [Cronartium quercuum f. sp. fusiforme G11]|uniref:Uncharacterized protein n=1 Tax=Cronartium quercuum f. sp. fusiforme G11 TaxID=708437 RepID=A0A9P6T820_9BASI|nr:hypothetical protein CROQUDRAFT_662282 [Cronartium quercuum f. sp. fusiforme G11]